MPDNRSLLVRLIPEGHGAAPSGSSIPKGPDVQESSGHAGPVRTYEDMLSTPHDEELFDYYATAQIALFDAVAGTVKPVGQPAIFGRSTRRQTASMCWSLESASLTRICIRRLSFRPTWKFGTTTAKKNSK